VPSVVSERVVIIDEKALANKKFIGPGSYTDGATNWMAENTDFE
jgi:hypothetical protein